jgi:hypothetical protein
MLPLQVGAIDPNRSLPKGMTSWKAGVRLKRSWLGWLLVVLSSSILFSTHIALADKGKNKGGKKKQAAMATATPGEESLTNIPLPIGREAKGVVLPDFDSDGHLRGKFVAATARRIDQEHVQFSVLKITTYTPENQPDLTIEMSESVFDLKTRILSSKERTTVTRADFNIIGDSVEFDTNTHTGKLIGNVKMVITDQSKFKPQTPAP